MRRLLIVLVLIAANHLFTVQPASAETRVYSKATTADVFNAKDLNSAFDIQKVDVALFDTDPDMIHFWILFAQPLTSNMFNDNKGSWAGILIDVNNDGNDDIVLNTLARTYSGNIWQQASGKYRDGSKSCTTVSWMDLDSNSRWLGFKVSQKCLGLANKFRVQGYADYISTDNLNYDYAPDSYETIDLGDYYNPKPKVTMSVPTSTPDLGKAQDNYALPPTNLVNLSASLRDSVATIECENGDAGSTGTAWSAKVSIPISTYKSFLITNYHVVSDCIIKGSVTVILNNNSRYTGLLAAWDPDNDIAGIYVPVYVPPLLWQGETPLQGAWVGVLGSPKGLPGILTTGIVSSVSTTETYVTFTAPINPGNSGGPVFDSVGRVVAIATAKVRDSEGFGIGKGVPLICKVVVKCSVNLSGWKSKLSAAEIQAAADLKAKQEADDKAAAELKAKQDADAKAAADLVAKQEADAKGAAELKAKQEADAKFAAELKIKQDADAKAAAELKAKQDAEAKVAADKIALSAKITSTSYALDFLKIQVLNLRIKYPTEKVLLSNYTEILNSFGVITELNYEIADSTRIRIQESVLALALKLSTQKTTITCVKGKLVKKVTAVKPVCPAGYKKR
jgi:hypothetical protein